MRKPAFVTTIALTLGLTLTPATALANHGGFHGGRVGVGPVLGGPVAARPFVPHPLVAHPFFHRPFFRPFVPFGVIASPVVIYAPPPVAYSAPPAFYYYPPPPTGSMAVAPEPPPMPTVVQYPTGRYELRGDGVTTPYVWVWIPNPPPAPPPPPPAEPPAPPTPPARSAPPVHRSELYRWTDEQGVVHWTDRWDAVPEPYRAQSKRVPSTS